MTDKKIIAKNIHSPQEKPEDGSEVYVFTLEKKMIVCLFRSGKFWIDYYTTLNDEEIVFWSEDIVLQEEIHCKCEPPIIIKPYIDICSDCGLPLKN